MQKLKVKVCLTVETSLLVRPDAFAKAVTALRLPQALEEGAVEGR